MLLVVETVLEITFVTTANPEQLARQLPWSPSSHTSGGTTIPSPQIALHIVIEVEVPPEQSYPFFGPEQSGKQSP